GHRRQAERPGPLRGALRRGGHPPGGAGGAAHGAGALLHHHRSRGGGLPSLYVRGERLHPDPRPEAAAVPPAAALSAADAGVGRGAASCVPQSAAGKAPTALRDASSWHRARVRRGGNAQALATESRRCAHRNRRPERRRPPYEVHRLGTGRGAVGWSTRMRWPPNRGVVHTVIRGRKSADRPTRCIALAPDALRCALRSRRPETRRPPCQVHRLGAGRGAVGWSTRMRWPPNRGVVHTAIGGRKSADRPTRCIALAPGAGPWGGQRACVGHRIATLCTPQSAGGKAPTALRDASPWHRARVRRVVNANALATGWRLGSGQAVGRPTRYYRVAIQISSPAWNTANATRQVTVKRRPLSSRLSQVMRSSCLRITASWSRSWLSACSSMAAQSSSSRGCTFSSFHSGDSAPTRAALYTARSCPSSG